MSSSIVLQFSSMKFLTTSMLSPSWSAGLSGVVEIEGYVVPANPVGPRSSPVFAELAANSPALAGRETRQNQWFPVSTGRARLAIVQCAGYVYAGPEIRARAYKPTPSVGWKWKKLGPMKIA